MQTQGKDIKDFRKNTKARISPNKLLELGKMPPQAVDIESVVLGALMLDSEALSNTIDILKPETFYNPAHTSIFKAIQSLFEKADVVDIFTVTQELKKMGELEMVGGAFYVTGLTNRIASAANIQFHARIIIEKFIQREIIRISTDTLQHSYEDSVDVFELLSLAEENIFSISNTTIKKTFEHISKVLSKSLAEIEAAKNQEFNGIQSGFTSLDRITGGWQRSDLIIIAARPGQGKSAFMMTAARNAGVEFGKPVAIFSLEMPATQLVNRLIAAEAEIDAGKLRKGDINENDWQTIHRKISKLAEAPIYIDDTPALSVFEFRAKARRLKSQYDVSMIIVDYLQLMVGGQESGFNREQEVSHIAKALKAIAKELDIPIIALSQMSRSVEQRGGTKRPQLSDLRESGSIEQEADVVIFIYRPFISGVAQDENGQSTEGQAEIIIAKHRNGKIDSAQLMFIEHLAKFQDPEARVSGFERPTPIREEFAHNMDEPIVEAKIEPNRDFLSQGPRMPYSDRDDVDPETGF